MAAANDHNRILLISAKTKGRIRQTIRQRHGARSEQYRLLATLIYLVVKDDLPNVNYIVIDKDYAGDQAESTIKNYLLTLLCRDKPDATAGMIHFQAVKGKLADKLAKRAFDGKIQPDRIIKQDELAPVLEQKRAGEAYKEA